MKSCFPLTVTIIALQAPAWGQSLVNGTNYSDLFGPADVLTVNPPNPIIGVSLGGSASDSTFGNYWSASANGGMSVNLLLPVTESGAQVALTGSQLQFNISSANPSLLDQLNTGLALSWSATATFDKSGNALILAPNTTYRLEFDVDGSNGLLNSALGILPNFGVEFLDGAGNAVGAVGGGTLVNIIGLEALGLLGPSPGQGRAKVQFTTGNTVGAGAASVRFTGGAILPVGILGIGTNFATISNMDISAVPEPSALLLASLGAGVALRRRSR